MDDIRQKLAERAFAFGDAVCNGVPTALVRDSLNAIRELVPKISDAPEDQLAEFITQLDGLLAMSDEDLTTALRG